MNRRANGEGAAFRRQGPGWATKLWIKLPDGTPKRVSLYAPTQVELREKVAQARAASDAGRSVRSSRGRVAAYVETWIESSLAVRDVAPGTRRLYAQMLRKHVVPILGSLRLGDLRAGHVELLHATMRRNGKSDAVRRTTHQALSLMCQTAVRDGLMRVNPVELVDRPADPPKRQPAYSLPDALRVVAAVEGQRTLAQLVPFLLFTGLRVGEALALRWEDIDLDQHRAVIAGTLATGEDGRVYRKGYQKDRNRPPKVLPLVPPAVKALQAAKAAQAQDRLLAGSAWRDLGLVFADQLGDPIDDRGLRKPYRETIAALGLAGSFHALRRSTATVLTAAGTPLPVVSAILGHSSGRVTQAHYVIVNEDMMRAAFAALHSAFGDKI